MQKADITDPLTYYGRCVPGWCDVTTMRFLAEQAATRKKCVEIGVWKGKSTACMAEFACGHIWAVDHFRGSPHELTTSHKEAVGDDNFIRHAQQNLKQWIDNGTVELVALESTEAMQALAHHAPFDFIMIDGGHTQPEVTADIEAWIQLLALDGMMAGHDVNRSGVRAALDDKLPGWEQPYIAVWTYEPQKINRKEAPMLRAYRQTVLESPDIAGDCWRACIATLLQIPIIMVPRFPSESDWPFNFHSWLEERELAYLAVTMTDIDGYGELWGLHIITGPSPRGNCEHAVIGYNGKIVFDPHPSNDGLAGDPAQHLAVFIFPKREGGEFVIEEVV